MFSHKLKCLLFLKLFASKVYCVENCSNLSPESLLIGHYCLSTCDQVCAQRVSFPGTINLPLFDHPLVKSDCEGGRGRLICMSTNLTPHGYPLCELLNLKYCKSNTCACWYTDSFMLIFRSSCISHQCPPSFTPRENQVTNTGCLESNLRVLCVS